MPLNNDINKSLSSRKSGKNLNNKQINNNYNGKNVNYQFIRNHANIKNTNLINNSEIPLSQVQNNNFFNLDKIEKSIIKNNEVWNIEFKKETKRDPKNKSIEKNLNLSNNKTYKRLNENENKNKHAFSSQKNIKNNQIIPTVIIGNLLDNPNNQNIEDDNKIECNKIYHKIQMKYLNIGYCDFIKGYICNLKLFKNKNM